MFIVNTALSISLSLMLLASATIKLTHREPYVQGYLRVGVPEERLSQLALLLIAGAVGLIGGIFWPPLGIAAATALVAYFLLAIAAHVRADDTGSLPTPIMFGLLAAGVLVLHLIAS